MELEFDESSLDVLRKAFAWSDFDGDGNISREDLKISSGLERDEEVEALFLAFKESGGDYSNKEFVSFDEFCKAIIDFPFLLEQFKQDFQAASGIKANVSDDPDSDGENDVGKHVRELRTYKTHEGNGIDTMLFLYSGLQESILDFNNALKSTLASNITETTSAEEMMETLSEILSRLQTKARQDNQPTLKDIVSGCTHLLYLVRDATQYYDESAKTSKIRMRESQLAFDSLKQHSDRLEETNRNLLALLNDLESETKETKAAHSETIAQKKNLQIKLKQAENSEEEALGHISLIKKVISQKENDISQLEKELRRLNSMKKIQEMRGTIGRSQEDIKLRQITKRDYRQTMPMNIEPILSPTGKKRSNDLHTNKEFNQNLTKNLKTKDELIRKLENELSKFQAQEIMLREDMGNLKVENQSMLYRLKEMQLLMQIKRESIGEEEQNIANGSNLYEEMKLIGEPIYTESNARESESPSFKPVTANMSTQTKKSPKIKSRASEKRSSCFSCF